jgi:hypothetical protein
MCIFPPLSPEILSYQEGILVKMAKDIHSRQAFGELGHLADGLEDAGLLNSNPLIAHLRDPKIKHHPCWCPALALMMGTQLPENTWVIPVNYERSIEDGIAAGRYDSKDGDITEEHFPPSEHEAGKKEQVFTLYRSGKDTDFDWVIAQMKKDGQRPATLRELLAFGETNPEVQRGFAIIALGSVWAHRINRRLVLCLDKYYSGRGLSLEWLANWRRHDWPGSCRFLVVGK